MNIIETNLNFTGSMSTRKSTTRIILHHAAVSSCDVNTVHRWHLGNGWSGIGYHFFIRKDGSIYRGRPENKVGAHASGANSNSIGICFEGDFESESMGETQKNAGKELVAYLKGKYGISTVLRHRDVGSTSCPGRNFPFSDIAGASGNVNVTTSSPSSTIQNCLGKGDRGADVAELQNMLISCGFSCGKYGADGVFGSGTDAAVRNFQSKYGLSVDGLAGVNTMSKLRSLCSGHGTSSGSGNWVSRLQAECNAQKFSKQTVDGIPGKNTLAGCPTVKIGASGNITKLIQERLISLGYSCGSCGADGKFGNGTKSAVIAFQKAHGLSPDGIVGQNTWRALLGM